jgi:general secretion pathway protein C
MPRIVYHLINLAALTLISFFCVDIFYQVVTDHLMQADTQKIVAEQIPEMKKAARPSIRSYGGISDRALFGVPDKPATAENPKEIETLEPTKLKLALLGTVEGDESSGWAIIMDKTKRKQDIYRVGDSVQEALIKKIVRNKVILRVGDRNEVLTIEEGSTVSGRGNLSQESGVLSASPSIPGQGPTRTVTLNRSELDASLQDINKILSEARIQPHFNRDNEPDGLMITGIRGNSLFRRMGFRNGDIIQSVDGSPIASSDDIVSMYGNLKSASSLDIQVIRRGREQTINYRFR